MNSLWKMSTDQVECKRGLHCTAVLGPARESQAWRGVLRCAADGDAGWGLGSGDAILGYRWEDLEV